MKQRLQQRYDRDFVVSDVNSVSDEAVYMPFRESNGYSATAYPIEDETKSFRVYLDKEGDTFQDNYGSILFAEPLKEYTYKLLEKIDDIEVENYEAIFTMESSTWDEEDELEDYMVLTDTYVCVDIRVYASSSNEAAKKCYQVYQTLLEHSLRPSITFYYGARQTFIMSKYDALNEDGSEKTEQQIEEGFRHDFEKEYRYSALEAPLKDYTVALLENIEDIEVKRLKVYLYPTTRFWEEDADPEEVLQGSTGSVSTDIDLTASSENEVIGKCYDICRLLIDRYTKITVTFEYGEKKSSIEFSNTDDIENVIEKIKEDFSM
ncbi:MAG: hypothetical protein IJ711_05485 [Lachnospiraceae bacterium]|nr:hypothetical protein [Lachnospiraceae bacterium]